MVVVGDHCTDDTAARLAALDDDRVRFHNLPYRAEYPQDDRQRWMVAGTPGVNIGNELARGDWIAPLDDDDTWTPDHLELLLDLALAGRYEVAYGRLHRRDVLDGSELDIYRYPPAHAAFHSRAPWCCASLRPCSSMTSVASWSTSLATGTCAAGCSWRASGSAPPSAAWGIFSMSRRDRRITTQAPARDRVST